MKYVVLLLIGSFIGMIILTYTQNKHGVGEDAVKVLKLQNDSLLKANLKLDSTNSILYDKIKAKDYEIKMLESIDENMKFKIEQLNIKIQSLNKKHAKAIITSNNFTSNELQVYFSNLR